MPRRPLAAPVKFLGALAVLATLLIWPSRAPADTLQLNAAAASECPACATATGGAQVVNYLEQLAPQTLPLTRLGLAPVRVELSETILDADADEPVLSSPGDDASVAPGTTVRVFVNPPASRPKMTRDERCRPADSTPAGDPGPNPGSTNSDPRFESRPAPALAGYPGMDLLAASARTIHLWWGDVPRPGKGWGYRHIMERRGYGPGDESDTAAALLDGSPVPVDPLGGTSYLFHKFYDVTDPLTGDIVHCGRTVLVNFYQRDSEPAPRDIITSYYGMYDA